MKRSDLYKRLLLDIISGAHPPGERLDETTLTRQYKTGRAAVRDALFRLDLEGLVHRRPRVGTTVTDLNILELQQVFEARVIIEVQCASLAAQLASLEEAAAIRKAFDGYERVIEARDFRQLVRLDQEFHQSIARASHNRYLLNAVTTLHNSTLRYWYFALQRRSRDQVRAAIERHLRTAAAIESRDASAAEREMRVLVAGFLDVVKGMIGQSTLPEATTVP